MFYTKASGSTHTTYTVVPCPAFRTAVDPFLLNLSPFWFSFSSCFTNFYIAPTCGRPRPSLSCLCTQTIHSHYSIPIFPLNPVAPDPFLFALGPGLAPSQFNSSMGAASPLPFAPTSLLFVEPSHSSHPSHSSRPSPPPNSSPPALLSVAHIPTLISVAPSLSFPLPSAFEPSPSHSFAPTSPLFSAHLLLVLSPYPPHFPLREAFISLFHFRTPSPPPPSPSRLSPPLQFYGTS